MKVSQTSNHLTEATPTTTFDERSKSHDDFFSACIDLVPAKIYLNPEDRLNWIKLKANEGRKRREEAKTPANGQKKAKLDEAEDDDEDEEEEEGQNERETVGGSEISFHKFDPRFFKTVTEVLRDLEVLSKRLKKPQAAAVGAKLNLAQSKARAAANGAPASTELKVFNKSQNKPSKAALAMNAAKQAAAEAETSAAAADDDVAVEAKPTENGSAEKKRELKRSKAKQERQAQMKRQRYDSQCEPQIETIEHPEAAAAATKGATGAQSRQPILNKNGQIVYSKFDFTADKTLSTKKSKRDEKALPSNAKPNDYKKLLKKLQERREKVEEMKQTEPEKARELEQKEKWKTAIDKAAGVKVKDDIGLLKKSLKKVEKRREKSRKSWDERKKAVETKKKSVQEKRMKNINERKEKKKENKLKKLRKKGRILGF